MSLVYLAITFIATSASLLLLKPIAERVGLVDIPGGRKTHIDATPLVGGLGIFTGILVISALTPGMLSSFGSMLSLSSLILFIGTIDDARNLSAHVRMTGHALVALVMAVVANIQLTSFGDLLLTGPIDLGILSIPVTIFATVGVINAINMSDGIDGLSGGLVIVALGFVAALSFSNSELETTHFILVIVCAILAFLSFNFRRPWKLKALMYLGDAGSTMLGFMLAWILIESTQGDAPLFAPVYALWFLAIPLFDTVNLLIKRPLHGFSPFTPGTDHLHHNLMRRGFSVEQVVAILVCASMLMGGIGILGIKLDASDSFMFVLFLALFAAYLILSEKIAPSTSNPG